jgi:Protein of unknown function (DUF3617)
MQHRSALRAAAGVALLCALGSGTVMAQPLLKSGLWEITSKTTLNGQAMPNMGDMLKNMSPAQRKQMEAMMAKQGVSMPSAAADGSTTAKVCMTPQHIAQGALTQPGGTQNCSQQAVQQIGNTMKFSFVCTQPAAQGEGVATWNSDNTQFTNKVKMRSERNGKPYESEMEGGGKWLGADCGNVKPLPLPKAAK